MANTRHPPPRHARESGHPEDMGLSSRAWIPAFAGMTKSGYLVTGAPQEHHYWLLKPKQAVFGQEWFAP